MIPSSKKGITSNAAILVSSDKKIRLW